MDHTITIDVDGMTCANCEAHVREELEQLPGVRSISVDLRTSGSSPVQVVSDQALGEQAVRAAIDQAGYTVTAIR